MASTSVARFRPTAAKLLTQAGIATAVAAFGSLLITASSFAADNSKNLPAGGATLKQDMIASAMVGGSFSILVLLALSHRNGRSKWLDRVSTWMGKQLNLPNWVALPSVVLVVSLLAAVFGLYWDVSLHLSQGRDPGPLANPAHYFILFGLLGCFSAGALAITMPKPGTRPSPYSVELARNWHAPLGGMLIAISAGFGLVGFPLDDIWHRLFGQDVTLWGPTHLLMLSGAALTLIGQAVLLTEGTRTRNLAAKASGIKPARGTALLVKLRKGAAAGGILAGLSIFQGEFDFGIPQFQLVFHPILLMVSAGIALVLARSWAGKGGAFIAIGLFITLRSVLFVIVDPILGRPTPHFPLYLGSAIAVELVGALMASSIKTRPMVFAAAAGAGIGTLGLGWEWLWSHIWVVFPWGSSLFPEGAITGFIAAMAGAFIGMWIANSLSLRPRITGALRFAPAVGAAAIVLLCGFGLHQSKPEGMIANVTTQTVKTGKPGRWITATVHLNTNYFDTNSKWTQSFSWQGPGFINAPLTRIGPATYRMSTPMPAFGKWKTLVRFHKGNMLAALPLYEPEDAAIPKPAVPALASFTRTLHPDRVILQRESRIKGGTVATLAYFTMLAIALLLLALLTWGIMRVSEPEMPDRDASGEADTSRPRAAVRGGQPATA